MIESVALVGASPLRDRVASLGAEDKNQKCDIELLIEVTA